MAVRFTAYGGAGEIGGNKLLLEDDDWQIFFDFGMSFGTAGKYFEEFLQPRPSHGLSDFLQTGLLPPLEGLYRSDLSTLPEHAFIWNRLNQQPGYRNDIAPRAVLLSHAHADHVGYVSMLRNDIPIITSATSALIAKAMQDGGQSRVDAQTVFLRSARPKNGLLTSATNEPFEQRPWQILDKETWTTTAASYWTRRFSKTGPAAVTCEAAPASTSLEGHQIRAYPTDHSIPGTVGFAVETSAGWVGYTGDIRVHGRRGAMTLDFAHELAKLDVVALICEGTQAGRPAGTTEDDVRNRAIERIASENGLVVADFGPRNIERLETFLEAARMNGRKLVVLMKDALLLKAMATVNTGVPTPSTANDLLVYSETRSNRAAWQEAIADEFEDALIAPEQIRADVGSYVLCFSFFDVTRLLDIGETTGVWIYSSSEPYNEEAVLDMGRLRNWTDRLGLDLVGGGVVEEAENSGFHASGHAAGADLRKFIEIANPRTLIPVHLEDRGLSFYRETFADSNIELRVPDWGQPIMID